MYCILYFIYHILYIIYCILYNIYCILHIIYCMVYILRYIKDLRCYDMRQQKLYEYMIYDILYMIIIPLLPLVI